VLPIVFILVLLAAKKASPSIIFGKFLHETLFQVSPPSDVTRMEAQFSVGSPTAIPCRLSSKKVSAS
jgi:hypothetical protein